jgi:hypothetical protein
MMVLFKPPQMLLPILTDAEPVVTTEHLLPDSFRIILQNMMPALE